MWFEVPEEPPTAEPPRPIFPWESAQARPARAFAGGQSSTLATSHEAASGPAGEPAVATGSPSVAEPSQPETAELPATQPRPAPAATATPSDPWTSFSRLNAWDDVPEIGRYVEGLQKHRRQRSGAAASAALSPAGAASPESVKLRSSRLTDFPSEVERPSLPVTPAPMRRPLFWGDDAPDAGHAFPGDQPLPEAHGVPAQAEWVCAHGRRWGPGDCPCNLMTDVALDRKDPAEQLQRLARQQSEALLRRLGTGGGPEVQAGHEIPSRPLPFGSEPVNKLGVQTLLPSVPSPRAEREDAADEPGPASLE